MMEKQKPTMEVIAKVASYLRERKASLEGVAEGLHMQDRISHIEGSLDYLGMMGYVECNYGVYRGVHMEIYSITEKGKQNADKILIASSYS